MSDLDKVTISWSEEWSVNTDGTPKELIKKTIPMYSSEAQGVSFSEWENRENRELVKIEDETVVPNKNPKEPPKEEIEPEEAVVPEG